MSRKKADFDDARIHLHVLGQDRELSFRVRVGPAPVTALLPTAREISRQISAVALEQAAAEGREVTCRAGCGACCRQIVPISSVEAVALAEVVAAMPPQRRAKVRARFAAAVRTLEEAGLIEPAPPKGRFALRSAAAPGRAAWEDVSHRYFALGIPCPFLEDESCSIYADRPLPCREYNVTTPAEWCAAFDPRLEVVERPARLSEALTRAANAIADMDVPGMPLTLALEWAEVHGAPLKQRRDGEEMFWALLEHMETEGPVRR